MLPFQLARIISILLMLSIGFPFAASQVSTPPQDSTRLYAIDVQRGQYTDYQHHFSFQYPASWRAAVPIDRYDQPAPGVIRRSISLRPYTEGLSEIRVDVWENTSALTPRQWFDTYERIYYTSAATVKTTPEISIAGRPSLLAYEAAHDSSHGRITALAGLNNAIVAVEYYTNDGGVYQQTFLDIVRSLTVSGSLSLQSVIAPALPAAPLIGTNAATIQVQSCCGWTDPNPNSYDCSGGNCTWWAKYKRPDIPNTWHNAGTWRDSARQAGFAVGYTARVGAIAVWQPNVAFGNGYRAGPVGHVAYVTTVNGNGTFVVTSMSWGDGCTKGDRGVSTFTARETGDEQVTFIYARNQPPTRPNLAAPGNGATLNSRTVTLQWQDTGDPDNLPNTYRDFYVEIWKSDNSWSNPMSWKVTTSWGVTVPSDGVYYWHVKSGDGQYGSDWSDTWSFTVRTATPPNVPNLLAPANGATLNSRTVTLQWQDTGDPDNAPNNYRNYSGSIWNAGNTWSRTIDWQNGTSWTGDVPADGVYSWHIQSGDGAQGSGWTGTWSFNVRTPPAAPADLVQSDGIRDILAISWSDLSDNEDGFRIYKWGWDGTQWEFLYYDSVGSNSTRFIDTNLECSSDYYYQVSAYNSAGESSRAGWIKASTSACPAPDTPLILMVSGTTESSMSLAWNDNSSDEDGFNIYKWGWDGSNWDFYYLTSVSANTSSFTDVGLSCDTHYFYQVSAYNSYGESDRTNWVEGVTESCPAASPTATSVTPASPTVAPPTSTPISTPAVPPASTPVAQPTSTSVAQPTSMPVAPGKKNFFLPMVCS